jgi:hypothetical protein
MKNRYTIILLCAIAIGLVAAASPNAGSISLNSTPNDSAMLDSTPNDLPDLNNIEFKIDTDSNYLSFDPTPVINTETSTQMYHHCP